MPDRISDARKRPMLFRLFNAERPNPVRNKASTRVIFIPWDTNEGLEWTTKCQNWCNTNSTQKGKTFTIVNYDSTAAPSVHLEDIRAQADAVVYMRGHGSPSSPTIKTRLGGGGSPIVENALRIQDACDRLIEMGLKPEFPGAIKFFFCYSGTVFKDLKQEVRGVQATNVTRAQQNEIAKRLAAEQAAVPQIRPIQDLPVGKSLARAGADHMRKKGYVHCLYYGYLGPLQSVYSDEPADFDDPTVAEKDTRSHKQVLLDSQLVDRSASLVDQVKVRASVGRVRV